FDWLVGLYGASIRNVLLNRNGVSNYPPPELPMVVNDFETRRTDTAVFGTANYHFGAFTLETGLRLTETRFRANVFVEAGGLPDQTGSMTSKAALPKISLSYALPHGSQVYANIAKGEEPGAVNTVSTAPLPYRSEKATSYEIGSKGETDNRQLEYEVAAFYIDNSNHQFQTNQYIADQGGLVTLTANIGDSRTYGIETSGTWHPLGDLSVAISGGYLNAKWKQATSFGESIDGKTIPNAPEVTAALNLSYSRSILRGLQLETNLDTSYTDAMWWDLPNTRGSKEPPYWIGNARLAIGSENHTWQVALRATNLFGARYWTEYFPNFFPAGANPCDGCNNIGAIGAPRIYSVSVQFNY
ncbi:MAG: TonB-dependent receptor, partial [Gammaproteobacteria bacterium]